MNGDGMLSGEVCDQMLVFLTFGQIFSLEYEHFCLYS